MALWLKMGLKFGITALAFACGILNATIDDQIIAYYQIQDFASALKLINLKDQNLDSTLLKVELLTKLGMTDQALLLLKEKAVFLDPKKKENFLTLENLSWSILSNQNKASEQVQIAALVGAFFTQDAKAAILLKNSLYSSNYKMRAIAATFVSHFRDPFLIEALLSRLKEEKQFDVKIELIRACGKLKLKESANYLEEILLSSSATLEMKKEALVACTEIFEGINIDQLKFFLFSKRTPYKRLGLKLLLTLEEVPDQVLLDLQKFLSDEIVDVRQEALITVGFLSSKIEFKKEVKDLVEEMTKEKHPMISLLANWAKSKMEKKAHDQLFKYFQAEDLDVVCLAIKLAASVSIKAHEAVERLLEHQNPFIRLNSAITLLEYNHAKEKAVRVIDKLLDDSHLVIMEKKLVTEDFSVFFPSKVRHHPFIPAYPKVMDGMARMNILNVLAIHEPKIVKKHLKNLLMKKEAMVTFYTLGLIMQEELEHFDDLKELSEDKDPDLAMAAAMALAFIGKEPTLAKKLEKLFEQVDFENKIRILEALGAIGNKESIPFLIQVMQKPFSSLQIVAATALIQTLYH